jgi:hypothetical protein
MKKLTTIILASVFAFSAIAAQLTLVWDANPTDEQITGYNVFENVNGTWVQVGSTDTTNFPLGNVVSKRTWAITATNYLAESVLSDPVSSPNAPGKPRNVKIVR